MARPTIVRADTLDLQDPDAPHAANHSKNINGNGIAPHQAAQFQQIAEERHSEEQALADAWAMAGTTVGAPTVAQEHTGEEKVQQDSVTTQDGAGTTEADEGEQEADDDDDDLMDRISSSPSINDEDIDFEFVYALHTFTATVEGQANATKGDTMVLLDDSNSYWWLVRVVKDSSIGYLPAEHIETPTERLARLNKHRNIDLSQSMLGDNPEKSRNPLKIAMRRRNAKTVQFAAPTYVEASDYDYSDDEEHAGNESFTTGATTEDPAANGQPIEVEERNAPEEANVHATRRYSGDQSSIASKSSFDSTHKASLDGGIIDDPQLSPKLVDRSEAAPLKSRKGTPRNTDSFLKDDTIETRKITLTPGLLREDGNTSKSSSMDSQRNTSMESLTKTTSPSDSAISTLSKKDSKDKKKDKSKGGMLSGLFKSKKKDKKNGKDEDAEDRASSDNTRVSSPQQNGTNNSVAERAGVVAAAAAAGRDVQVQSRSDDKSQAPSNGAVVAAAAAAAAAAAGTATTTTTTAPTGPLMAELQGSEAAYEMVGTVPDAHSTDSNLKQVPRSKQRASLEDYETFETPLEHFNPFGDPDEHDEEARMMSPSGTITDGADFVHIPTTFSDEDDDIEEIPAPKQLHQAPHEDAEMFTDARENVKSPTRTPAEPTQTQAATTETPARGNSTSSHSSSGVEADTPKSVSVRSHDSKHVWDDGALRAWLDAEEVKDMLTIVHSSAHAHGPVEPVSDDHPLMRGLYAEERGAVDRMMTELDTLLMGFASRRGLA